MSVCTLFNVLIIKASPLVSKVRIVHLCLGTSHPIRRDFISVTKYVAVSSFIFEYCMKYSTSVLFYSIQGNTVTVAYKTSVILSTSTKTSYSF
jgi:hypothetical protein